MDLTRRKSYTAAFKLSAVKKAVEIGNRAAAREFEVDERCIRRWVSEQERLEKMPENKRSRRSGSIAWPVLEDSLEKWALEQREKGLYVSTVGIRVQAKIIAEQMGITNFAGGPNWCFRFMKRKKLSVRTNKSAGQKLPVDWLENETAYFEHTMNDQNFNEGQIIGMEQEIRNQQSLCLESSRDFSRADTNAVAEVQIKTEVIDVEETMDNSMPDITVETHESVEELRRVLNLPDTQIHREQLTIKSEEFCSDATSLQSSSLGVSNTVQSASDLTAQSSNWEDNNGPEDIIIGIPKLSDETLRSENLDHHNVCAIRWERNSKYPIIDLSVLDNAQSGADTNKVCRSEADHPPTQMLNTSKSSPISNPTFYASESHSISSLTKDQYSAMIKEGLKEKIRRRHHSEMTKKISGRKESILNIPYFKSIKYDPDLNFLLSLMPFLKSLSPSLRSKARAQIKEMIMEPLQSPASNKTSETFVSE